jgi:hypothetical protein
MLSGAPMTRSFPFFHPCSFFRGCCGLNVQLLHLPVEDLPGSCLCRTFFQKTVPIQVHCLCVSKVLYVQENKAALLTFLCPGLRIRKFRKCHQNNYPDVRWNRHRGSGVEGRECDGKGVGGGESEGVPGCTRRGSQAQNFQVSEMEAKSRETL